MNPFIQSKNTIILPVLIVLTLGCFGPLPKARAACQEGCFANLNTVLGDGALLQTVGPGNTALGYQALSVNVNGRNTGVGAFALQFNDEGFENTATGYGALTANTTGQSNTATGAYALDANTTGSNNTASGDQALVLNTTGNNNTATGNLALSSNTTGSGNTAIGAVALKANDTGGNNTAVGKNALGLNIFGDNNVAVGFNAGANLHHGSNNIDIGNVGVGNESKTIRIGSGQLATYIAGISGATVPTGVAVIVDAEGHLGTTTSSARFKDAIKPMDKASEAILALKPVTFRYKHELDPAGIPRFGLVAEEVEKVNPDLVARDDKGKPYTVRYEAVNAMLLNEFLKEHRKNEEQQAMIARLEKQVEALTAGLQKVSAHLERNKTASQIVLNNQ